MGIVVNEDENNAYIGIFFLKTNKQQHRNVLGYYSQKIWALRMCVSVSVFIGAQ